MNEIYFSSGDKGTFYKLMGAKNERKTHGVGMEPKSRGSNHKTNFNETCRWCGRNQSQLVQPPDTR